MAKSNQRLSLRLPFTMADKHLRLEQILAADSSRSWADSRPLLSVFAMSRPERRFSLGLLTRKRNVWLFRCNQRRACGDFIAVDMSSCRPALRRVWVLELKSGTELKIGGGLGIQMRNAPVAVDQLADARILARGMPFTVICGDYELTLHWLVQRPTCR